MWVGKTQRPAPPLLSDGFIANMGSASGSGVTNTRTAANLVAAVSMTGAGASAGIVAVSVPGPDRYHHGCDTEPNANASHRLCSCAVCTSHFCIIILSCVRLITGASLDEVVVCIQ